MAVISQTGISKRYSRSKIEKESGNLFHRRKNIHYFLFFLPKPIISRGGQIRSPRSFSPLFWKRIANKSPSAALFSRKRWFNVARIDVKCKGGEGKGEQQQGGCIMKRRRGIWRGEARLRVRFSRGREGNGIEWRWPNSAISAADWSTSSFRCRTIGRSRNSPLVLVKSTGTDSCDRFHDCGEREEEDPSHTHSV